MKKLRTAVVGLGRIGWKYHIPNIVEHNGFNLVAVADPMEERLNEAKEEYSVKVYTNYDDLLRKEKLDLVVIASPTPFHYEQSIVAMDCGVDVFLEKPMVQSLEEADEIIKVMKKTGRKLMVYQPHRIMGEAAVAASIIKDGLIGQVYMLKRAIARYVRRNDWQSQKRFGGGMLNNYGPHYIDQMLYLTSSKAKYISCSMMKIASLGDADDVVKATIETENDIILDIDINMACAVQLPPLVIMGSRGTAVWETREDGTPIFRIRYYKESELKHLSLKDELAVPGRTYSNFDEIRWYEEEIAIPEFNTMNFYDKCYAYYALGEKPFVPIEETREVIRVISECRKIAGW